ncbi:MAG: DUF5674 family protein [Bacteroidales bacterium]|jgi:hypothetical protein|nr:DUF5674 family protein [Bacteroidales bacterium]
MQIIGSSISINELKKIAENTFGDMIKGVVDVSNNVLAIDAELHSDIEAYLLTNNSKQDNLWGINLYPYEAGDDFLEFDSMINIRPRQGNKSRGVDNVQIQEKIKEIVYSKIK